jgi:diacylglycerol O-acyltransferase
MVERQRLGAQDALWLEMDKPGNLMVVDSLFWTANPIDWPRFRDVFKERLWDRYPVFRSVVVRGDDGAWYWEEQPDADLEQRYEKVRLRAPGGDAELQRLIAEHRVAQLDRGEPLWHVLLVDNFHGGSAVLFRAHHAIADGIRMVQLAFSIFDTEPGAAAGARAARGHAAARKQPAAVVPEPEAQTLVGQVWSQAAALTGTSVQLARSAVTNPVGAAHSVIARRRLPSFLTAISGDVDTARKLVLGTRNDSTGWTGAVGQEKAMAWSPAIPLDEVKTVAHAHHATVNDVLVTCVADSLRAYLEKHDAVCHSVTWDVPVNLKPFDPDLPVELGNGFALVQLELPTNIDDPVRALEVVKHRMGRIKGGHEAVLDYGIQAVISRMSTRLYRATIDLLANRAIGVLTNVPGPQVPLYVAGEKLEGMMGWAPLTADQVMSFTIYSYDRKVFVGIAADAGLVPDHEQIVDGFTEAFHRLSLRTA